MKIKSVFRKIVAYINKIKFFFLKKKNDNFFKNLELKYNEKGYYFLNPMPSSRYLDKFYNNTYWQYRDETNLLVKKRDLEHFKMIMSNYKSFNLSPKKILNFGSGYGGIQNLFSLYDHTIYNCDLYYKPDNYENKNIFYINSLDIPDLKFDLIYSSHSLEHVSNIEQTFLSFKKLSNKDTIYFIEVPNYFYRKEIEAPHTYYFTRKFFFNSFEKVNFCETFTNNKQIDNEEGAAIRFHTCSKIII